MIQEDQGIHQLIFWIDSCPHSTLKLCPQNKYVTNYNY